MRSAVIVGKLVYFRPLERVDLTEEYLNWLNDSAGIEQSFGEHMTDCFIPAESFSSASWPVTMQSLEEYFAKSQSHKTVMFAVCDRETDAHIGNARISHIDWVHRAALYGRLIGRSDFLGRGYGTDTLIQLLRFGFHRLGLNRLWTAVALQNAASLTSNDKVGMTREGVFREFRFLDGRFHNAVSISMLRSDFDEIHGDPEIWERREKKWREQT
jgi:RimJ/RimL family protein N-acetyltransferase